MVEGDGEEVAWLVGLVEQVRSFHDHILETSGGLFGERTPELFASVARAFHTFGGEEVYPTVLEKAAALFHGIICGHGFNDGSKRTGTMAAIYLLAALDYLSMDNLPSTSEIYELGDIAEAIANDSACLTIGQIASRFQLIFGHRLASS